MPKVIKEKEITLKDIMAELHLIEDLILNSPDYINDAKAKEAEEEYKCRNEG